MTSVTMKELALSVIEKRIEILDHSVPRTNLEILFNDEERRVFNLDCNKDEYKQLTFLIYNEKSKRTANANL